MNKKRVLVLGAGAMGYIAAKTISSFDEVESVIIADRNIDSAKKTASDCGEKATAKRIDVTNRLEIVALMREVDVIMNCVGPFFRFGVTILESAIEAGIDYLDICDDPDPTKEMHELNNKAKDAGITAIIGLGASPGIINMLSVIARRNLDETHELTAGWNIEEPSGGDDKIGYSAAIVHWMQQCSGTVLECENGKLVKKKPLKDIDIYYPGRGKRTVYSVGHPEPVSFYYSYPDLKNSRCVMVMPSMWIGLFKKLSNAIDNSKMTLEEAGKELIKNTSKNQTISNIIDFVLGLFTPRMPIFFVIAKGMRDQKPASVATCIKSIPPGMNNATGIPLALGMLLLLKGKVIKKGVIAPEVAFDPDEFFRLLAPYCTFPKRRDSSSLIETLTF